MDTLTIKSLPELPFDVQESLSQLRINLGFCGDEVRRILVTSSAPNEGKSFISVNLWRTMAEAGMKVLLIDCDLRNSEMRSKYGLSVEESMKTIAHYLSGKAKFEEVVYQTNVPNGYIIPMKSAVINPFLLFEGKRFETMMEAVKVFDYVIIDTPPIGNVADALKIAPYCDGTILVSRSGSTPKAIVKDSVQQLRRTGAPMLGVVLNRAPAANYKGGYYSKSRYGYGYGKKYGYGRQKVYGGKHGYEE